MAPIITAAALPAISAARKASRRAESRNKLVNILLALQNFHGFAVGFFRDTEGR